MTLADASDAASPKPAVHSDDMMMSMPVIGYMDGGDAHAMRIIKETDNTIELLKNRLVQLVGKEHKRCACKILEAHTPA